MQVKSIMQPTAEVVHVDENLLDAAIRLRRNSLPALAVVDGDEIVGILTAAAVEAKLTSPDNDLGVAAVRDLMSAEVGFCHASESLETARRVMTEEGQAHLLVTGHDGKLCGVLSAGRLAGSAEATGERTAKGETSDRPHVVATGGRAKGDKPHRPNNYSVEPKLKD